MTRGLAIVLAGLCAAASPAPAQKSTLQEGEAILGIAAQNDIQKATGVRLSPVGLNIGVIVQPVVGRRRVSIVDQLSFFPIVHYERQTNPFGEQYVGRTQPLILNTLWARWSTDEPEIEDKFVYFAGGGVSFAILTPRDGSKVTPMVSLGMRRWFQRQNGLEISLQCGALQVGKTVCVLPLTTVWPFG